MASATRSLPVPLSPVISTVTSRGATRATRARQPAHGWRLDTIDRRPGPTSPSQALALARALALIARARSMTASSTSGSKGFLK
jgi:hypothetical protein